MFYHIKLRYRLILGFFFVLVVAFVAQFVIRNAMKVAGKWDIDVIDIILLCLFIALLIVSVVVKFPLSSKVSSISEEQSIAVRRSGARARQNLSDITNREKEARRVQKFSQNEKESLQRRYEKYNSQEQKINLMSPSEINAYSSVKYKEQSALRA